MGVEKVVPALADVAVFLRLLARSATGQPITAFSTTSPGPIRCAPITRHIVIVDAGRSSLNADPEHRRALSPASAAGPASTPARSTGGPAGTATGSPCPAPSARCWARRSRGDRLSRELPFASTLCGSCTNVCPVKIDLHDQLLSWRRRLAERKLVSWPKRFSMRVAAWVFSRPALYGALGRWARRLWPVITRRIPGSPLWPWVKDRALPPAPKESFRDKWRKQSRG